MNLRIKGLKWVQSLFHKFFLKITVLANQYASTREKNITDKSPDKFTKTNLTYNVPEACYYINNTTKPIQYLCGGKIIQCLRQKRKTGWEITWSSPLLKGIVSS